MRREEFYYDSHDGQSQIFAVRYEPDEGNRIWGILQVIHGMAEYMERYKQLAVYLAGRGFVITGEDHLGHGGSIGEKGPGYFCSEDPATVLVEDVHRLRMFTQQLYPDVPYIMLGHSMGSFILRNYLVRYGKGLRGAMIMGTGVQAGPVLAMGRLMAWLGGKVFGADKKAKLLHKMAFAEYNEEIDYVLTPYDWLSTDRKAVQLYLDDPMCGFVFTFNGFATLFELIRRCQRWRLLRRIPKELTIVVASGEEDPVGAYGSGPQKLIDHMVRAKLPDIEYWLYAYKRHELLHEKYRITVMKELYAWLCLLVQKPVEGQEEKKETVCGKEKSCEQEGNTK